VARTVDAPWADFGDFAFTEVIVSPPSLYLIPLKEIIRKEIQVAAQNCYFKDSGAFTGEIRLVRVGCPCLFHCGELCLALRS
jgi:triosephosphate isomerase